MVGIPFSYRGKSYAYAVGQPMGAYSSWAVFSLAHHYLIRLSAYQVGVEWFEDYRVLGDDVVIRHNQVAEQYLRNLKVLGVGVSQEKTLVSPHTFEFSKRI